MVKNGVFLARFQPLHNGHLYMVEKALKECENLTIMLGSANKYSMLRNPFDLELRKSWLYNSLENLNDRDRINVFEIPDWSYENDVNEKEEWGLYLYYNIVSRIQAKTFSIFYNDDLSIIESWFSGLIRSRINIVHSERSEIFNGLSATKIREAILNDDAEYLRKYLPLEVRKDIPLIKNYLLLVKDNPMPDFSME